MKPSLHYFLFFIITTISITFLSFPNDAVFASARDLPAQQQQPSHSSSSPPEKKDWELVASPNGTVYLLESESQKPLWSFPSGPPIYLSYQAPVLADDKHNKAVGLGRNSFIDYEDDGKVYLIYPYEEVKFEVSIEDYVKKTPIYEDDAVTVGSMDSTVFKIDFRTGKLIDAYGKSFTGNVSQGVELFVPIPDAKESERLGSSIENDSDAVLYIERIDYSLSTKAFDKLLWNFTIAFFKAKLRCKGTEQLVDGTSLILDPKIIYGPNASPCGEEFIIIHVRKPSPSDHSVRQVEVEDVVSELNSHGRHGFRQAYEIHQRTDSRRVGGLSMLKAYLPWSSLLLVMLVVVYAFPKQSADGRGKYELIDGNDSNALSASSRRKKSRKSGKNILDIEEGILNENVFQKLLDLNSLVQNDKDGRKIGKLFVSRKEIAKGSNGTVVYEGIHEGRKAAVKRLVQSHHMVAYKEIQNLIASDRHPNIVRWYGVEYDNDFVYLALERCSCNLYDLVLSYADSSWNSVDGPALSAMPEYVIRLKSVKSLMPGLQLWKNNGYPSAVLLHFMRGVVSGLVHLHELGIVHRDLKPQNVLISKDGTLCAKLSDMGISKRLLPDMSSLGHLATGHGSCGWQAPEQLLHGRQTRAVDMFSLGCVLFYCVTGGSHPFGDRFERDTNIIKNKVDLFLVETMPEALDLFSRLLQHDPNLRPKASDVLQHPFFWSSETRVEFLHDTSDRVESEDRASKSDFVKALESIAPAAISNKWDQKIEPVFLSNIRQHRSYRYESVRDLLRVIRNKKNHYRELPVDIQGLLGSVPDGFDEYFTSRFPELLIEVYRVVCTHCSKEKWFQKYLPGNS